MPSGPCVIDPNNILTAVIHNLKMARPTKIAVPYRWLKKNKRQKLKKKKKNATFVNFEFLELFYVRCKYCISRCWLFWGSALNILILGRRCSTHLMTLFSCNALIHAVGDNESQSYDTHVGLDPTPNLLAIISYGN